MASMNSTDMTSKSVKKKKKDKKKAGSGLDGNAKVSKTNGDKSLTVADVNSEGDSDGEPLHNGTMETESLSDTVPKHTPEEGSERMHPPTTEASVVRHLQDDMPTESDTQRLIEDVLTDAEYPLNSESGTANEESASLQAVNHLNTMQQERDNLRTEVGQLRRQLESLQKDHSDESEIATLREELEQSQQGKEHAETLYQNLLGKVNTIRSQLGERFKAIVQELEQARERIEELEASNNAAIEDRTQLEETIAQLNTQLESQASENDTLRSRTTLSRSNWAKERDELVSKEAYIREEYDVAKQAMQDWEFLATDERARRKALEEKSQALEDQLHGQREAYERVRSEVETQSSTVDGLQRALRDVQEERRRELREMVEQSQTQLNELRQQAKAAEDAAAELNQRLGDTEKELNRALPFEKEVRDKSLLIGKLRHEAVILNDHLTKALRFLKRGKPEDNVDRQLITNHFLHFLAVDRSDPKKFQVLQLIAALLGWNEEQREQAGLLRQGSMSNTGSLKLPVSPFRRIPSTPSLSSEFVPDAPAGTSKESLAELWSEFLEREAEAGANKSRTGSTVTSLRSPSLSSVPLSSVTIASVTSTAERPTGS